MTIATAARICTSTQRGFFWPFVLSCRIEIQVFIFWSADQTDSDREWRWGRRYGFSLVDYQIVGYIIIRKKENQYWLSKIIWKVFLCLNSKGPARCLKITEKISLNIASEASYFYILSGQKLIKNAKNGPFWQVFENLKLAVKQCYQTGQF